MLPIAPSDSLNIRGARTHNLKNVSLSIPHNQLTVLTGVSGSGKSSLAFDTLYAEGQRQYIESLSPYARQFLNQLQRPDVDSIEGLQPTLCIDQRAGIANPRSTVATVTEVYDYLRLMMARVATPHCPQCGIPIDQQSPQQIQSAILRLPEGTKLVMMAPVVRGRRGSHRDVLNQVRKAGLVRVRVDHELHDIDNVPELSARQNHTIDAVVDKIVVRSDAANRVAESLAVALRLADGLASISYLTPAAAAANSENVWIEQVYSTLYACPTCGVNIEELEPRTFSFNSPYGACPACQGQGKLPRFNAASIVGNWELSPQSGAFAILTSASGTLKSKLRKMLQAAVANCDASWTSPLSQLTANQQIRLMEGTREHQGLIAELEHFYAAADEATQDWLNTFRQDWPCGQCGGARLRPEALAVKLNGQSIHDICSMPIDETLSWFEQLHVAPDKAPVAQSILAEMLHRLRFLNQVGVGYLTLGRAADSLSGGELQRVRLATSIGSGLVGVCYILDEPSIGLHQCDNDRLIASLRSLQQQGNTVIVVEHDEAMMRSADRLVDMGPGAGEQGGQIIAAGTPEQVAAHATSLTAMYLRGERSAWQPGARRRPNNDQCLILSNARLHNLQGVDLELPLGLMVGITGVSGSGKSSLISDTLVPALARKLGQAASNAGPHRSLQGAEQVDKLIEISQAPIGRSPRSTPATYCGVFDLIRGVWANTRYAKQRGFTASRFSFNTGSGRCPQCQGQGQEKIEMNFLPDLYVPCSSCGGARYNRQTLQVRYRDLTISDVLNLSVSQAASFFENFTKIHRLLSSLEQVGLGYLSLGQSSNTLSGGEAQRIKLATELARPETGKTIYFLDEPTTGLHFEDVRRLINVMDGLVERGNTVIVIEHNLDVVRACDWLIDLGPGGGQAGGQIVGSGSPEQLASNQASITGRYLDLA